MRDKEENNMIIRKAKIEDAKDITQVYIDTWKITYKDLLDKQFLNSLTITEEQINKKIDKIKKDNNFIVCEVNNKVVGVLTYEKSINSEYPDSGEIKTLYVLYEYQKKGIGKKLFNAGVKELIKLGFNDMIITCLVGNKSNDFYVYMGGKLIKQIDSVTAGEKTKENLYYFENINIMEN